MLNRVSIPTNTLRIFTHKFLDLVFVIISPCTDTTIKIDERNYIMCIAVYILLNFIIVDILLHRTCIARILTENAKYALEKQELTLKKTYQFLATANVTAILNNSHNCLKSFVVVKFEQWPH